MDVTLEQTYGNGFVRSVRVPVINGFFESNLWLMSDERSFKTRVKLNSGSEYLKIEQQLEYASYIDTNELYLQI